MSDKEDEIARELLADLSEAAGVALQPWIDKPLTTDKKQVQRAPNVVLSLAEMLKNSKEPPPFGLMLQAVKAAYVIGKHCVVTPTVEKFLECERAAHARGGKEAKTPKD